MITQQDIQLFVENYFVFYAGSYYYFICNDLWYRIPYVNEPIGDNCGRHDDISTSIRSHYKR